jgi:hypothetical protein
MTRLSVKHGAINLSRGFPDFPAPMELNEAARTAIAADINPVPDPLGSGAVQCGHRSRASNPLRMDWVDAERHVAVTCGSTEAMIASMPGVLDPGDENGSSTITGLCASGPPARAAAGSCRSGSRCCPRSRTRLSLQPMAVRFGGDEPGTAGGSASVEHAFKLHLPHKVFTSSDRRPEVSPRLARSSQSRSWRPR